MSDSEPAPTSSTPESRGVLGGGVMLGIGLKVASVFILVSMSAVIKSADGVPVGQLVFFRSFFALIPVMIFLGLRRELVAGIKTEKPWSHVLRGTLGTSGMFLIFFGLTRLPLPEATTINYATPLFVVVFSAVFLHEKIRMFRWTAVLIGLLGVLIIMWPRLTVFTGGAEALGPQAVGALAAFAACMVAAAAQLLVRTLVRTERSATIVVYFSIVSTVIGLMTIPFGWVPLDPLSFALLVGAGIAGGIGQIMLTESYRHAEISTIAPFEYSSMVLSILVGLIVFGEIPTPEMLVGGSIVVLAGIFIIYREHMLGLDRTKARKVSSPA